MMLNVLVNGICGKMGSLLADAISTCPETFLVGGVDRSNSSTDKVADVCEIITNNVEDVISKTDVIIDFSHVEAFENLIDVAVKYKTPVVSGTTGLSQAQIQKMNEASKIIPILYSSNFSTGVYVLNKLVSLAVKTLSKDAYDIEILEQHHRDKKDAPSGTALNIAKQIADFFQKPLSEITRTPSGQRSSGEIGFSCVRGGSIFGEHEVMFLGKDDSITIKHTAFNRSIFVNGALLGARWLVKQKAGLYDMSDLMQL